MVMAPERITPPTRRPERGHRSRAETSPAARPGAAGGEPDPDALVAQAIAARTADPRRAAEGLLAVAGWDRALLERARSLLIRRLRRRRDDLEAVLALTIVERALAAAPHRDGSWRWHQQLSPRRIRSTRRRAARSRARNRSRQLRKRGPRARRSILR